MVLEFTARFNKDLRKLPVDVLAQVANMVSVLESANDLESSGLDYKKMKGRKKTDSYYRIRLGGYRVGVEYFHPDVILLRVLKRGIAYKYFPPK